MTAIFEKQDHFYFLKLKDIGTEVQPGFNVPPFTGDAVKKAPESVSSISMELPLPAAQHWLNQGPCTFVTLTENKY